ncbi:MAG: AAA family ATPase [Planctomycetaceae bacterium]|nr:AAA family ATPase [Planctomycetaceae bacterium]
MNRAPVNSEILDRLPPHDATAERSTIGCLLLEPSRVPEIAQQLGADDFYVDANRRLFGHIVGLYAAGSRVDEVLLLDRLRSNGDLEAIGGHAYLAEILQETGIPANASNHAQIVLKHSQRRRLIRETTGALVDAYDDSQAPAAIASSTAERLLAVTRADGPRSIDTPVLFAQTLQDLAEPASQPIGRTIGFKSFDTEIGGLYPGELAILAARPSMGKTALATQVALYFAEHGRHALIVTLEMPARSLAERILANRAGVSLQAIRSRSLSHDDRSRLVTGNLDLPVQHLHLVDRPRMTVAEIRWEVMLRRQKHSIDLVVVDYLTRLQPADPRQTRYLQVAQITADLKDIAAEFAVPVLCLAQLGRAAEAKGETRPRLSHLRESGDIEQDADVIAFLHRPERVDRDDPDVMGKAYLFLEKNRNGPCGEYPLTFDGPTGRFSDGPRFQPFDEFTPYGG